LGRTGKEICKINYKFTSFAETKFFLFIQGIQQQLLKNIAIILDDIISWGPTNYILTIKSSV
jgi:hypothetical protein